MPLILIILIMLNDIILFIMIIILIGSSCCKDVLSYVHVYTGIAVLYDPILLVTKNASHSQRYFAFLDPSRPSIFPFFSSFHAINIISSIRPLSLRFILISFSPSHVLLAVPLGSRGGTCAPVGIRGYDTINTYISTSLYYTVPLLFLALPYAHCSSLQF